MCGFNPHHGNLVELLNYTIHIYICHIQNTLLGLPGTLLGIDTDWLITQGPSGPPSLQTDTDWLITQGVSGPPSLGNDTDWLITQGLSGPPYLGIHTDWLITQGLSGPSSMVIDTDWLITLNWVWLVPPPWGPTQISSLLLDLSGSPSMGTDTD